MTNRVRWLTTIALTCFIAIGIYFAWTVYSARQYTTDTLLPTYRGTPYPLTLADLSPRQLDVLLNVEDPGFYRHRGIDLSTPGAGITTITQALVKLLYFEKFRPGIAKLKQTAIALFALDPLMDKNDQLTLFINIAYFAPDVRGFSQASTVYFDKPFTDLTEDEYIALVAMLVAPATFDAKRHPERNRERVERIKLLLSGKYVPRGLFDIFYGKLDKETQQGLPPLSYFESHYQ